MLTMRYERWHTGFLLKLWRVELHYHTRALQTQGWRLGWKAGDGVFALATPWFTVYW